jgi:ComF family protein
MVWRRVDEVLGLLFPPRCLLCGATLAPAGVAPACHGCLADLPWLEGGVPDLPGPLAAPFAEVRAALLYQYPVDRLVAAAKFGRQLAVARGLGQLLHGRLPPPDGPPDAVVPVPLHWRREAARGFNQAGEIARALCERRGWPFRPALCRRVRPTPEQSALGADRRRDNLRDAFVLAEPRAAARCRHVLLVDDVLTTGATVTAVAGLFLAVGVPRLSVWTVAWTPPARQVERKV